MEIVREIIYQNPQPAGIFFLAADIGGTNSNFAIFDTAQVPAALIVELHAKSQKIADYTQFMRELCDYIQNKYSITLQEACIGAAGVVSSNRSWVKPTN